MTKTLVLLAAAVLLVALPAAAHVTVDVDPLTGPLQVGVPTDITVLFSEPCFEMPIELATGNDELTAILDPTAPSYVTSTAGQTVPWTIADCPPTDPTARLVQAASLTVVIDAFAPAFTNVSIPVNYRNANGESGEAALLNVTVAHYANGTLTASKADHDAHGARTHNGTAIKLTLDYSTNAESLLTFEVETSTGEVHEIDAVRVSPPSFKNESSSEVDVLAAYEPPAGWTSAELTFTAYLTPVAGGARVPVGNATLALANDDDHGAGGHDADGHAHDEKDAPAPAFALVGLAMLAFAARRR